MSMIKKGKSGSIKQVVANDVAQAPSPDLQWTPDVVIKDVLEVPLGSAHNLDIDLESVDEDEIAVKC